MYYIKRNQQYLENLKQHIEKYYNINIKKILVTKRGCMAETYILITNQKRYFVKIVYYPSHKNTFKNSFSVISYINSKGINFISNIIKTKNSKLYTKFSNGILGVFEYIEGIHCDNYPLSDLFNKYSCIYNLNITNINIHKEDFNCNIITTFNEKLNKLMVSNKNRDLINFINLHYTEFKKYEERLIYLSNICKHINTNLYITHGDGQGNVIVKNTDISIIDWDTPLFAPIERDAWVFLNSSETLQLFLKVLKENSIEYSFQTEILYYYCYWYLFYYFTQYFEMLLFFSDSVTITRIETELKDFWNSSNWLRERITFIDTNWYYIDEQIPDLNLFMVCQKANKKAFSELSDDYHIRKCRKNELITWMEFPFDTKQLAIEYREFMEEYYRNNYLNKKDLFFDTCLLVCDKNNIPIATCFAWKQYNQYTTIHWFKVKKDYEGQGIGRALLSFVIKNLSVNDYPIYLHTKPGSYRAIKLYLDFGFTFIDSPNIIDNRTNDFYKCTDIFKKYMSPKVLNSIKAVSYSPRKQKFIKLRKKKFK